MSNLYTQIVAVNILHNNIGSNNYLNENSGKVMKKCNMKYEGTMRKADKNNQGICDVSIYAILGEGYIRY